MPSFSYTTQGVCARTITFDIEDGKIYNLKFDGGCAGNLQAIAKLVDGKDANEKDVEILNNKIMIGNTYDKTM